MRWFSSIRTLPPWLNWLGLGGLWGLALGLIHLSFRYAIVNADAGYYLSLVEGLADGQQWYQEVFVGYSPLALYGFSLAKWLGGAGTNYEDYLLVSLLIHFLNAGLVYRLSGHFTQHQGRKWAAAGFFLLLTLTYEGEFILLEPACAFFALLGMDALLRADGQGRWLLGTGVAVVLGFLCKQYGLLLGLPVLVWLVYLLGQGRRREAGKALAWASLGAGLMLGGVLLMYWLSLGLSPLPLLQEWAGGLGRGYGDFGAGRGLMAGGRFVLISFPILLLIPALRNWRDPRFWLLVVAFLGFSLPLYVKTFQHYLLLPLPFGVLLSVYVWEQLADTRWRFGVLLALGLMAVSSGLRGSWQASFLWEQRGERTKQSELAKALNERIPRGTAGLLLPTHAQAMNYLAGFRPVDPKGSGYAFPSSFDETYFRELLQASPPVITDEGQRLSVPWQEELMQAAGYELVGKVGELEIWEVR